MTTTRSRADLIAEWQYGTESLDGWAITQADRDRAAKSGAAMPDGSYPITACSGGEGTVDAAVHAVGRGGADHDAIRRHVIKRAKALGCPGKIPDNWNGDGTLKTTADDVAALQDAPPPPTSTEKATPPTPPQPDAGRDADANTADAISELEAAVQKAQKVQSADPDQDDEDDKAVASLLNQAAQIVARAKVAQAKDAAGEGGGDGDGKPPPPTPPPPPGAHALPGPEGPTRHIDQGEGVDDNGNVEAKITCADPDCQHLAVDHQNTATGANSGPCTVGGCHCEAMKVDTDLITRSEGGPDNAGGEMQQAAPVVAPPPETAALNAPPEVHIGESGEPFTIPVGVIEGQQVGHGDPRGIALDALTWRQPPMPLMGLDTATHDPGGFDMNDPSVLCGVIENLERRPGEADTQVVWATGHFFDTEDGEHFAALARQMGRIGISADIAVVDHIESVGDFDDDGVVAEVNATVTDGVILGFTIVPFPAFEGCYLVLGDGTLDVEPIPMATEDSVVAAALRAYSAPPNLMDEFDLEACQPCHGIGTVTLTASAAPDRPPAAWFSDPQFELGDGRVKPLQDGKHAACPITVTEDGQVFGHIAPWGVCHTGIRGECVVPPRSHRGYADFRKGHVITAEGERVEVGHLTADTSHAPKAYSPARTMLHYEDTGTIAALGSIGEDEFGIWFAGSLAPWATESQAQLLRSTSASGDWRNVGGNLELHAALMVPTPGFPIAFAASGNVLSLVAAGAHAMAWQRDNLVPEWLEAEPLVDHALRQALDPVLKDRAVLARSRIAVMQARDRLRAAGVV
jgi:hypothetical protein